MTNKQVIQLAKSMMGQNVRTASIEESLLRVRSAIAKQSPATRINLAGRFRMK